MADIVEFLLARIGEDEAGRFSIHDLDSVGRDLWWIDDFGFTTPDGTFGGVCDCTVPERILAECAAKRRIIDLHEVTDVYEWNPSGNCRECSDSGWAAAVDGAKPVEHPCPTLRLLAVPYADHPDFEEAWRL